MKFLLTLLIFLLAISAGIYYFVQKNQVAPQQSVIVVAEEIPKYPNASSWEINVGKKFCVKSFFNCGSDVPILFSSKNSWPDIYNYFRLEMDFFSWKTNSQIYTSIPGSIIFTKENCQAELSPNHKLNSDTTTGTFNFQVSCSP